MQPTKIYVKPLLNVLKQFPIKGMAHITGGGLLENIPRVLPDNLKACLDTSTWQWPKIFTWLQEQGSIAEDEMYRTFNCGVGMVLIVAKEHVESILALLAKHQEDAFVIGEMCEMTDSNKRVQLCPCPAN